MRCLLVPAALRWSVVLLALTATEVQCQLSTWLLRSGNGEIHTLDLTAGSPILGPLIPTYGWGGSEDINLMTNAAGGILFTSAVGTNDKVEVRNAAMVTMPNGTGLIANSSSQASAISPRPCHPSQYYIIHHNTATHKSYYSVVDMALVGGLGDVAEKNVLFGTNMGEGLAVSHRLQSGCRWLFGFSVDGNKYVLKRALITATSIGEPEPIDTITGFDASDWHSTLKLNPANDRLVLSLPNMVSPNTADVALWSLDLESGTVGDAEFIALSDDPIVGIEFSPSGDYLYFVGNAELEDMDFGRLHVPSQVVEVIDPAIGEWILSIECAGNGRLYVGASGPQRSLAEVRYPDAPLAGIGYNRTAVVFPSIGFRPVLPNAIEGEPPGDTSTPAFIDFNVDELPGCEGHLFNSEACLATWQQWDFGDGWTDLSDRPVHHYGVGTFDVTLTVESCGQLLSLTKPALLTVEGIQPIAEFTAPDSACQRAAVSFENGSQLASSYLWLFGNGQTSVVEDPIHHFMQYGSLTTTLIATEGCIHDTARASLTILPAAIASFHTNSDPCDEVTRLINTSYSGQDWFWEFGDGDSSTVRDPLHTYLSMEAFEVHLTTDRGTMCADTAVRTLHAGYGIIPVAWFIPNAFTPNGDGTNDVLSIKGPEVCASPVMTIHNKWGQPIWEGDSKTGWDGTSGGQPAPEGVYVYVLQGKMDRSLGYVVLIR
ncbi:MAG: gliding motility-associated C-terminal domain-containing protein [Flavobacteriales bacterium]|nr:gliding motility-associated C-terminal domain-containing protein [Flavobacteriales bacterium]